MRRHEALFFIVEVVYRVQRVSHCTDVRGATSQPLSGKVWIFTQCLTCCIVAMVRCNAAIFLWRLNKLTITTCTHAVGQTTANDRLLCPPQEPSTLVCASTYQSREAPVQRVGFEPTTLRWQSPAQNACQMTMAMMDEDDDDGEEDDQ